MTKPIPKWMPELVALALLIPLVLILTAVLAKFTPAPVTTSPTLIVATPSIAPEAATSTIPPLSPQVKAAISSEQPPIQTVLLEVRKPTEVKTYRIAIDREVSVTDVMSKAADQGLVLETKNYGGTLGLFVAALNGLQNDLGKQKYWTLYVNGKRSEVGMSTATVKPNDSVTWKFETLTTGN